MRTRRRTNTGNEKEKLTIQNYSFFVIKDPDPVKSLPDPQHWTNYDSKFDGSKNKQQYNRPLQQQQRI